MKMTEPAFDIPKITDVETVTSRRFSTGRIMMPNVGMTVISRYLRNPQGSCHDICKYGTRVSPGTESMSPRSSIPKDAKPKQVARQSLTEKVGKFGEGRKKWLLISSAVSPDSKTRKPDVVVAKIAATQSGLNEGNDETNLSDEKKLKIDVCMKPFPESERQKHVASDCIRREVCSWTDKETVSPKRLSFSFKETDIAIDYASFTKMKPQWKPPSILKPACSRGKLNHGSSKSKDSSDAILTNSLEVSSGRNKDKMTGSKRRNSMRGEKRNLVPSSSSLSPKQSGITSSSMNKAKTMNSRCACHSKKKQRWEKKRAEKSCGKSTKGSKNLKGVSHLTDQKSITKPNSAQGGAADVTEKTLFIVESNPENKHAESNQTSTSAGDLPKMPSSSSQEKFMKLAQKKTPTGQFLDSFKPKIMIYRPKEIHAHRLPPSSFSIPGKKVFRSSPLGTNASSKSTHDNASSEHDEPATQKQTIGFKMMKTTSKDIHLQGEKLNFQRGQVIEVPLEDCTPRRLQFNQRAVIDSRNDDDQNGRNEKITPRRLKFRQNGSCEDHTQMKLRFKHREQDADGAQKNAIEVQSNLISLRHHDIKENKVPGSLYNNMIEETAMRLAGSKRSKVKAMVRAFESVISRLGTASFSETK